MRNRKDKFDGTRTIRLEQGDEDICSVGGSVIIGELLRLGSFLELDGLLVPRTKSLNFL